MSLPSLLALSLVICALPAAAHIRLDEPAARYSDQKVGPCGKADGERTDRVTVYKPGATITVRWTETIDHPGHFRVAFDDDGDDDFPVPAAFDDTSGGPTVLVDGIADASGGEYEQQVTLPDVECESCTLQLIQMMTDKPPYGDGNDLYFQCADIALRADAPDEGEYVGPDGPAGCACAQPASRAPLPAALALALSFGLLLRRRRAPRA